MTDSIQGLYYGLAVLGIIVSVGFGYIRLYVKNQLLELRVKIIEDVRSEFAPLRAIEEMDKRTTRTEERIDRLEALAN